MCSERWSAQTSCSAPGGETVKGVSGGGNSLRNSHFAPSSVFEISKIFVCIVCLRLLIIENLIIVLIVKKKVDLRDSYEFILKRFESDMFCGMDVKRRRCSLEVRFEFSGLYWISVEVQSSHMRGSIVPKRSSPRCLHLTSFVLISFASVIFFDKKNKENILPSYIIY